jgi:molybdopterin converting factor small subunit
VAVDIEIFGQLQPDQPRRRSVDLKTPATAGELAAMIGLDVEEIGLVTIDGVQSGLDHSVQPGSRLCFFPYVSGG